MENVLVFDKFDEYKPKKIIKKLIFYFIGVVYFCAISIYEFINIENIENSIQFFVFFIFIGLPIICYNSYYIVSRIYEFFYCTSYKLEVTNDKFIYKKFKKTKIILMKDVKRFGYSSYSLENIGKMSAFSVKLYNRKKAIKLYSKHVLEIVEIYKKYKEENKQNSQ